MNASNIIQISRDIFLKNKKNIIPLNNDSIEKLNEIYSLLNTNINSSNEENNWREYKSNIKPKTNDKKILTKNEINSNLNKLSIKNFETISQKILDICKENNTIELLDYVIDNIFSKAVFQPVYCQYYVKLLYILIDNSFKIIDIITNKCNKFSDLTFDTDIDSSDTDSDSTVEENTEQGKYDLFCKKIKDKTYKAGYSQFIGELYNKDIIEQKLIIDNINRQLSNLEKLLDNDSDIELIEDNIICACQLINTTCKKLKINNYSFDNIKTTLNDFKIKIKLKRLKFKIMDLLESM